MKITNRFNLPQALVEYAERSLKSPYETDERNTQDLPTFRTTSLIGPPRVRTLWLRHKDDPDFVLDAVEFWYVFTGDAYHKLCEGADGFDGRLEHRYEYRMLQDLTLPDGRTVQIGATADHAAWNPKSGIGMILDNKTCVARNLPYGVSEEYTAQMNIYADMLGRVFPEVTWKLLLLRYAVKDFTWTALDRDPAYPRCPMAVKPVELWPAEKTRTFILDRLLDHLDHPDRLCTTAERSFGSEKYRVTLPGQNRALRVLDSEAEARQWLAAQPATKVRGAVIQTSGTDLKCKFFCRVARVCDYARSRNYPLLDQIHLDNQAEIWNTL